MHHRLRYSASFVYPTCRSSSRRLSRPETLASQWQFSSSSAQKPEGHYAPIPHRAFISVTGSEPNLSTFLNGILSTQVAPAVAGEVVGFYTSFLNRHGRVLYDVFFHPHPSSPESGYLIEYDPRTLPPELKKSTSVNSTEETSFPPLLSLLKRFVLRSKVRVQDVSDEWSAWARWGNTIEEQQSEKRRLRNFAGWRWAAASSAVEPTWFGARTPDIRLNARAGEPDDAHVILPFERCQGTGSWDWRAPGMGRRVIVSRNHMPQLPEEYLLGSEEDYTVHRIMNGVPEGTVDMAEAIPFDRNVDVMGGIDFRKGCYVGQENVVRTYHTGMIRKRTVPVQITPVSSRVAGDLFPVPFSDIKLRLTSRHHATSRSPTATMPPTRSSNLVRAKGKLLSQARDWALAQIRTEHLDAYDKREMEMFVEGGRETTKVSGDEVPLVWSVVPKVPSWWPRPGSTNGNTSTHK